VIEVAWFISTLPIQIVEWLLSNLAAPIYVAIGVICWGGLFTYLIKGDQW
jgi:hypothetical protein